MSKGRVLLFSLLLSSICAGLLGMARGLTAENIAINERLDERRSILEAADFQPPAGKTILQMPAADLDRIYETRVQNLGDTPTGPFAYKDESGRVLAHVVRVRGKGLWGDMFGFLAVDPEPRPGGKYLLRGLTFYKEDETPGLGKRINEAKFKGQFRADRGTLVPGLQILKGEGNDTGPQAVDGITSATVTSTGVQAMVAEGARWYVNWRKEGGR